jgi:(E)-4-hydroxy-3-methylbut-2-enyl-diphosphate synthase
VTSVNYKRRETITVNIGQVPLGSSFPIRVQSMANTLTSDLEGSVGQCMRMIEAGADYIRFTIPSLHDVEHIAAIRKKLMSLGDQTPLIADVHFNADIAFRVTDYVAKVRINPGNYCENRKQVSSEITDGEYLDGLDRIRETFKLLLDKCQKKGVALRIGVNHGSLSERIMRRFGDTPAGMAESAMEFLRICKENGFNQVVVSMKASNVRVMVQATRLVTKMMEEEGMHFPLHLGVTEAGDGEDGRIKSAAGIGALLHDGLGDTIRVSLTEDPEKEIPVALNLVQHVSRLPGHALLPDMKYLPADPFVFSKRRSGISGIIGGHHAPVVIGGVFTRADYFFSDSWDEIRCFAGDGRLIIPYNLWLKKGYDQAYPLLSAGQYLDKNLRSTETNFVRITLRDLALLSQNPLKSDNTVVIVYECSHINIQAELRGLHYNLREAGCSLPVIIRCQYGEPDLESIQVKSAADLGGTFIDGFGDGLWLSNSLPVSAEEVVSVAFGILQACRARITRTEFISCPSCGRTNFNLMETLARIKKATSHLKGLKIGVMGCIVNGPGEMADADYGYVGAGKGRITLYKSKEVVKRGIPEQSAVDELIALIKECGDWTEP